MKLEVLNQKVSWALICAVALVTIVSAQQHRVNVSKANEQSASRIMVRYALENSSLRMKLETERSMNQCLERAIREAAR